MKKTVTQLNLKETYVVPLTRYVRLVTERHIATSPIGGGYHYRF